MMEKSIVINSSSGSNPITVDSSNDISSMEGKGPRVAMCVVPKAAVGSAWENESLSPIQNLEETSSGASSSVLLLQQVKIQQALRRAAEQEARAARHDAAEQTLRLQLAQKNGSQRSTGTRSRSDRQEPSSPNKAGNGNASDDSGITGQRSYRGHLSDLIRRDQMDALSQRMGSSNSGSQRLDEANLQTHNALSGTRPDHPAITLACEHGNETSSCRECQMKSQIKTSQHDDERARLFTYISDLEAREGWRESASRNFTTEYEHHVRMHSHAIAEEHQRTIELKASEIMLAHRHEVRQEAEEALHKTVAVIQAEAQAAVAAKDENAQQEIAQRVQMIKDLANGYVEENRQYANATAEHKVAEMEHEMSVKLASFEHAEMQRFEAERKRVEDLAWSASVLEGSRAKSLSVSNSELIMKLN